MHVGVLENDYSSQNTPMTVKMCAVYLPARVFASVTAQLEDSLLANLANCGSCIPVLLQTLKQCIFKRFNQHSCSFIATVMTPTVYLELPETNFAKCAKI